MRPAAKHHGLHEQSKNVINGPRPSPLMIHRDSHLIRKPSDSETKLHKQQRDPVIIYTQSPKVIHTKAQDFMALVQRLTGMSSSNQDVSAATASSLPLYQPHLQEASENFGSSLSDGSNNSSIKQQEQQQWKQGASTDGDETSSALRDDETCIKCCPANDQHSPSNLGFADMPLFTPNCSDFLFSSRSVYKYSDSPFGILGSLISPSGLEFIKELPEY